jgi:hypothetical protein
MPTQCSQEELDFGSSGGRKLVGAFDGGAITSNGGALLLGAADRSIRLTDRLAKCFRDLRLADGITHTIADLLRQRIFGLALGYEDLIDHDQLRHDPALAAVLDKPGGRLAGKSTLNRLEHADKIGQDRHHKFDHDGAAIERLFPEVFMDAFCEPPIRIEIDLDATDDPLYGQQEGRHFHGYYDCYCYLPLYIFCGRHLLAAKLRSSSADAAEGSVEEVARIVAQIRKRWPTTSIVLRADSGFCRDDLMSWCEANNVRYVLGLAGNRRLVARIAPELRKARRKAKRTGRPAREFADLRYRTRKSWSCERRVIGKAEWTGGEANPRFVVTNVPPANGGARFLYEDVYCQRRDGEPVEGVPGRIVRRPHADADHARQSAAALAGVDGLRADVRGAAHRARRHQAGARDLRHHSLAAVEDRRAGHGQRSAREGRIRLGVPFARHLRAGTTSTMRLTRDRRA